MRVNANIGQLNNSLNVYRINQSLARNNTNTNTATGAENERRDTVSISPKGKAASIVESLMKQKQNIMEQKNKLIGSTLEKGGTLDTIKSQLEAYEEQLKNIDEQIAQSMTEQEESSKSKASNEPKTEEEMQNEKLSMLTQIATDLKQSEVVSSVQSKVDGGARVLKSEIELDRGNAGSGSTTAIDKKELKLTEMQQQSRELSAQIGEKIAEITQDITDNNHVETVVAEDQNAEESSPEEHAMQKDNVETQDLLEKHSTNED